MEYYEPSIDNIDAFVGLHNLWFQTIYCKRDKYKELSSDSPTCFDDFSSFWFEQKKSSMLIAWRWNSTKDDLILHNEVTSSTENEEMQCVTVHLHWFRIHSAV